MKVVLVLMFMLVGCGQDPDRKISSVSVPDVVADDTTQVTPPGTCVTVEKVHKNGMITRETTCSCAPIRER